MQDLEQKLVHIATKILDKDPNCHQMAQGHSRESPWLKRWQEMNQEPSRAVRIGKEAREVTCQETSITLAARV